MGSEAWGGEKLASKSFKNGLWVWAILTPRLLTLTECNNLGTQKNITLACKRFSLAREFKVF